MSNFVPEELKRCADTYEERNITYGDCYKRQGEIMKLFFPEGMKLESDSDWNRMGIMFKIIDKLIRYNVNFSTVGHPDSLHDIAVYSTMLLELDNERFP